MTLADRKLVERAREESPSHSLLREVIAATERLDYTKAFADAHDMRVAQADLERRLGLQVLRDTPQLCLNSPV